ncbi:MAG: hypothetical protein IPK39_01210 [Sulfuritalea sp.]|nr:hypothetical protein [Sulfuritalea sp.]
MPTPTQIAINQHAGVGAVLGGLVGVGSLIGNGSSRDAAMVAGAIGGALAGNGESARVTWP